MELIKNIAVTDLMIGLFGEHPSLVALVYNAWPYGTLACSVTYYLAGPISYRAALLQVCAITLYLCVICHVFELFRQLLCLLSISDEY